MTSRLLALRAQIGGVVSGASGLFPGPGHSRKDRSLSIRDIGTRLVVHSFAGDDLGAVFRYLEQHGVETPAKARPLTADDRRRLRELEERERREQRAADAQKRAVCRALWQAAAPFGGAGEAYLLHRGIPAATISRAARVGDIRFHPQCPRSPYHNDGRVCPAMLALVRNRDGGCLGLHITFVRADGAGKAFGDRSRLMVAPQSGGAIRLAQDAPIMAVAEGIETALSFAAMHGVPTWAARSTNGLERFSPPPGVRELIIAADSDEAGQAAAAALTERMRLTMRVRVATPPAGQDWNDVLTGAENA